MATVLAALGGIVIFVVFVVFVTSHYWLDYFDRSAIRPQERDIRGDADAPEGDPAPEDRDGLSDS